MEANAIFAFNSTNADELSFPQGCTLKILDDSDRDWYKAELNGREGLVPSNYVQYSKPIWFVSASKEEAAIILNSKNGARPRHPEGAFIVRPSQNSPGDMSVTVRIGQDVQHFRIVRSASRDKYYLWSDAPHFTSVNELVAHYRHTSVSKSSQSAVLRDPHFAKVSADYDYEPQHESELKLCQKDVITVIDNNDPNWWQGRLERDGVVVHGLFPSNYVRPISD